MAKTETVLDLNQAIFDKIEELGTAEAAKFFGRTEPTVKKWAGGTALPDVTAAQKVLDAAVEAGLSLPVFSGAPEQGKTIPDDAPTLAKLPNKRTTVDGPKVDPVAAMKAAKKFSLLMPVNKPIPYATVLSLLGQWKATLPKEIREMLARVDMEPDTTAVFSRNRLATRFLENGDEWAFWMDSDIIAPIGNPAWFKRRTGSKHADKFAAFAALEQLASRGKKLIGGVYCERNAGGKIVAFPGATPDNKALAEEIKGKGPQDKMIEANWFGFGCVLVHRSVFEDILEKVKGTKSEVKGQPHDFFTPWKGGNQGEDMAFCERARMAGHQPFLDLSVFCGHIGNFAFMP